MDRLEVSTECGAPFTVSRFSIREGLSVPFTVTLVVHPDADDAIDLEALVDHSARFQIGPDPKGAITKPRVWEGVCVEALQLDATATSTTTKRRARHQLKIAPR